MKLGNTSDDKQSKIVMIVLIVVIVGAVFFVGRNFIGGGGGDVPPSDDSAVIPPEGDIPAETTAPPSPAAPGPGQPPPQTATPDAPPSPPTAGAKPREAGASQSLTVFGSVTITYPKGWGVKIGGSNKAAVFTDGKAFFEVQPPDPKAASAKAIAEAALQKVAKGGKIVSQAADKVSGFDAYWFAVSIGGKTMRIVGIDGSTRVAVVAYSNSSIFPAYRDTFNKMQSEIRFTR